MGDLLNHLNEVAVWTLGALFVLGVAGVPLARVRHGSRIVYGACVLLLAGLAVLAALAFSQAGAAPALVELPVGLPLGRTLLGWDRLGALFATLINAVAAAVSFYAIGYGDHEESPGRVLPFYPAFLAGMNLVLLANDAFSFLVGWEFMSLSSWALVVSQDRDPANRQAGFVYLVMAMGGTLCLLLFFGLLAGPAGGYAFGQIRAVHLAGTSAAVILLLALAGTGSKAGLVPLHAWLPLAHPAAPSHVSALMSGVMTKVAIYAFIRFAFDLTRPGPAGDWLGAVLAIIGAATAVYAVLVALLETDIKRSLAWSTIENIGIIFAGLGLALAFQAAGLPAPAALALTAATLHAVNHAVMKSLLFCGAGSVVAATGQRELDAYGGLAARMPRTLLAMLAGSMAIAALPPLNGFVSEWLLFQAVLASPALPGWFLKFTVPAAGAALALAAALAAATFVRLFGITFLGRARSDAAAAAREADGFATTATLALAGACLVLGALPMLVVAPLQTLVQGLVGASLPDGSALPWQPVVPLAESRSAYSGLMMLVFLVLSAGGAALCLRFIASGARRRTPVWDCGFPDLRPATQYSAASFAQPLKRVFGATLLQARESVDMPLPGDGRPAVLTSGWADLTWEYGYARVARLVLWVADRLNVLQFLTIRRYLLFVFGALVALLVVVGLWR